MRKASPPSSPLSRPPSSSITLSGGAVREAMAPHRGGVPEIAVEFECAGEQLSACARRSGARASCWRARRTAAGRRCRASPAGTAALRAASGAQPPARECRRASPVLGRPGDGVPRFREPSPAAAIGSPRRSRPRSVPSPAAMLPGICWRSRASAQRHSTPPGRQQETGALKAASERLRALEAEHGALDGRRREFDARVDRLARLRDDRRRADRAGSGGTCGRASRQRPPAAWPNSPSWSGVARLPIEAMKAAAAEQARRRGAASEPRTELIAEAGPARRCGAMSWPVAGRRRSASSTCCVRVPTRCAGPRPMRPRPRLRRNGRPPTPAIAWRSAKLAG